jgi:hypothetical protein
MPATDPPADSIASLLKLASATNYCRPALRSLADALPTDDSILTTALDLAATVRDAKAFSNLYLAAIYAGRRLPGEVLALGAPLLPDASLILNTALRLDGGVAEALATAIRSGRMASEREAASLIVAWLDYERRHATAPAEFLALTRKLCRNVVRIDRYYIRLMLEHAATLSGDPVVARILNAEARVEPARNRSLDHLRKCASGAGWDESIPSSQSAGMVLGGGATVTRAVPKAGRNDPCPCGSGRKFKQCCEGKLTMEDQYAVDGVTIREATAHPELLLSPQRIEEMRSYELYALDSKHIPAHLAGRVVSRLAMFYEFARAIELMQAFGREAFSNSVLDMVAYDFFMAKDVGALRWLIEWAPDAVALSFEMEILLASPEERFRLLCRKAADAFASEREGQSSAELLFCDVAHAAILTDHALGLLIARGVLPVCGWVNQTTLIEDMEDTRDILGLDDKEPGYDIVDATDKESEHRARHAQDVEKARSESAEQVKQREIEIQRLKAKIDAMQETLRKSEEASRKTAAFRDPGTAAAPAGETAETRELRDHLRRLKENLKVEHDERNRAMQELRSARELLRRTTREQVEANSAQPIAPLAQSNSEADADATTGIGIEWERQPLRVTESSTAFREAMQQHPRQAAAAALVAAGRLAAGDPSIWKTVRALKARPGTLRARVAGDYRLLFETTPDLTLRLVDFILRRDLDRWLAGAR